MANVKSKEIQVQKPAQSLEAFKGKVSTGPEDIGAGLLKPVLIGTASLLALALAAWGFSSWQSHRVEKHEAALSALMLEVHGTPYAPPSPEAIEKKMREKLPELETLATKAPGRCKPVTQGTLAAWKLQLEGKATLPAASTDAWGTLRQAQRMVALGQGAEAAALLTPLKKKADASEAWAPTYWSTLMEVHRLQGSRDQAWKDYSDYKQRFKEQADPAMERTLASI